MAKTLVAYDSGYGATRIVAETIAATLVEKGLDVDIRPVGPGSLNSYDALLLGSPIRLGRCTPAIKRFLKRNLKALSTLKVAFFFTCMSVTPNAMQHDLPLFIDPAFNYPGKPDPRLRIMENNHTASYYLQHFLKHVPGIKPMNVAFFKGRLNLEKLTFLHRLIMRIAMFSLPEIRNEDCLNKDLVRSWALGLLDQNEIS